MAIAGYGVLNITAQDAGGNSVAGASIQINTETGLALTTIYSDRNAGTPISNPMTADANGYAKCYVASGLYQVKITSGSYVVTYRDVAVVSLDEGNVLYVGVNDTDRSGVIIYGDNAGEGGFVRVHQGATEDTTNEHWQLIANEGDLLVEEDSTERFRFKEGGVFQLLDGPLEVGVGDTTQGRIYIYGASTASGGSIRLYNAGDEDSTINYWDVRADGSYNVRDHNSVTSFKINEDGSTTISRAAGLVYVGLNDGSAAADLRLYGTATGDGGGMRFYQAGDEDTTIDYYEVVASGGNLHFKNNSGDIYLQINSDGSQSLSRDSGVLHVGQSDSVRADTRFYGGTGSDGGSCKWYQGASEDATNDYWQLIAGGGDLIVKEDSTTRVRFMEGGKTGFGTTDPDGQIHAHTATAGTLTASVNADELVLENNGNSGMSILAPDASQCNIYFSSPTDSLGALIRWTHDNNIMDIKTAKTSAEMIFASSNAVEALKLDGSQAATFDAYGAGDASFDANGKLLTSSDERLKTNITSYTRGLEDVLKVNPITYNWNARSGNDQLNEYSGYSAQNLEEAIPEAVMAGPSGYLGVSNRPIIAALINTIKELDARIKTLEGN